ncbi:FIG139612: Possible conserved membrane protein [hydrothermal vent metagenome]|uniref:FIG139612: Possible conserved membrane protein n=1 Tax=hydrothermal vent metagenome TaxID=652676 RepID=A0A3B0S7Y4_9ZZZZ
MIGPKVKHPSEHLTHIAATLAADFPALLSQAKRISANVIHGAHGRRKRGSGETFWQFRQARDEDPASAIDWRRSARSDTLFVRETEWEAANTIFLWRDASAGMNWRSSDKLPSKQDRAAVLLSALCMVLLRGGERCAVPGVSVKPGTGIGATKRIALEIITGASPAQDLDAERLRAQAHLVIASDFLEGANVWKQRLRGIQQNGCSIFLLHIADPAEELFPFSGHTLFGDINGPERIDLGRAQLVQTRYRERFAAARNEIRDMARQYGWMFLMHRTDHNPSDVFLALVQALGNGDL